MTKSEFYEQIKDISTQAARIKKNANYGEIAINVDVAHECLEKAAQLARVEAEKEQAEFLTGFRNFTP